MGWGHSPVFYGYRNPDVWAKLGLVGNYLTFTDDEIVTKLGLGYLANQGNECAMDAAVRYTLLDAGENAEISAKQMLNQHTRLAALVEENILADGFYRNQDGEPVRGWVVATDFRKLWENGMCSGWDTGKPHFGPHCIATKDEAEENANHWNWGYSNTGSYYNKLRVASKNNLLETVTLEGNERMLTNHLEDKVVLRAINKSLNRMVKSDKAVQVTAGRGRTFRWGAWGWLDGIRNKRLVTMAKQRKIGDVVNGWKFTKGRTTTTYGVEVCEHAWEPVETQHYYKIFIDGWAGHNFVLNAFFFDKIQAEEYVQSLPQLHLAGHALRKNKNGEAVPPTYSVQECKAQFILKPELTIEELPSPSEMFKRTQLGPKEYIAKVMNEWSTNHGRNSMTRRLGNY